MYVFAVILIIHHTQAGSYLLPPKSVLTTVSGARFCFRGSDFGALTGYPQSICVMHGRYAKKSPES